MVVRFQAAPEHLYAEPPSGTPAVILQRLEAELWSFVSKKANRHWIWIGMNATTRQVIAFYVGGSSQASAEHLWAALPAVCREQGIFYTDQYVVYKGVIPPGRHRAISKLGSQDQSCRALQLYVTTTGLATRAWHSVVVKEAGSSCGGHQVLHL